MSNIGIGFITDDRVCQHLKLNGRTGYLVPIRAGETSITCMFRVRKGMAKVFKDVSVFSVFDTPLAYKVLTMKNPRGYILIPSAFKGYYRVVKLVSDLGGGILIYWDELLNRPIRVGENESYRIGVGKI